MFSVGARPNGVLGQQLDRVARYGVLAKTAASGSVCVGYLIRDSRPSVHTFLQLHSNFHSTESINAPPNK